MTSCSRGVSSRKRASMADVAGLLGNQRAHSLQGLLQGLQQLGRLERLFQEVQGAGAHGLDGHRDVAVAGHHHYDRPDGALLQLLHKVEPAQPRQPHVDQEAHGLGHLDLRQEFLGGRVGACLQPGCVQQDLQGLADVGLVVDDVHDAPMRHGHAPGRREAPR